MGTTHIRKQGTLEWQTIIREEYLYNGLKMLPIVILNRLKNWLGVCDRLSKQE